MSLMTGPNSWFGQLPDSRPQLAKNKYWLILFPTKFKNLNLNLKFKKN